ncbi:MAG TPA: ligase-associated DNA damage response endonuclease PdeM, partial [Roseiflexaceae bacterium]|nr:ligase-associated DNA damage response endonuclease PdeM [Roseiflexaceae bacterium]
RLDRALERCDPDQLMLLGDALHARSGRGGAAFEQIAAWRSSHAELAITLIRGNHDRGAGDPPAEWVFECVDAPFFLPPFALCHAPAESPAGYVLAGHLHPVAQLRGAGRQRLRLPCFWFGGRVGVLPAFGSFTGGAPIAPTPGDRVFVLADDAVVEAT